MKSKDILKLIGVLSLIGGIALLFISLRDLVLLDQSRGASYVRILVAIFAFSQIFGSLQILSGDQRGGKLLIFCYLVETFAFSLESFAYLLTSGPILMLKYDAVVNNLTLDLSFFQVAYKIVFSEGYSFFSINLLSLGILIYLLKVRDKSNRA